VIYICIPALDEARTIGVLLWKIRQVMEEFPRDYHILVLDDGSTDDTKEVLEPYVRVLPVTVLRNERTQGYPAAVEKLVREAVRLSTHPKRDVVVTIQADFTENPDDIPNLLKRLEGGADVVGSTVTGTEGELPRSLRWSRRGLPWLLTRAQVPKEIKDPLSGFRAYRVSVLKRALQDRGGKPLLTRHGWAANAELLLAVAPHVRRAEEAEVQMRYTRRERTTRFRPWNTVVELWGLARKAPGRLREARAAIAARPPEAPDAPAVQEHVAERVPERGPRPERGNRPERGPRPERTPQPERVAHQAERGPRPERGPKPERAPQAQRGPRPGDAPPAERGPKPERPPRQRREERPAAAAATDAAGPVEVIESTAASDGTPPVAAEVDAPAAPRKRRRPPRRRGKRGAAQAGAEGQEPSDGQEAADARGTDDESPSSSGQARSSTDASTRFESADDSASSQTDASADGPQGDPEAEGEAQAPARKRSRPRRPRRPRSAQPSAEGGSDGATDGGASGGFDGGAAGSGASDGGAGAGGLDGGASGGRSDGGAGAGGLDGGASGGRSDRQARGGEPDRGAGGSADAGAGGGDGPAE